MTAVPDGATAPVTPGAAVLVWRGISRGCAVCGRRGLTTRWLRLAPTCPRCGFRFERTAGHFVGAVGVNTIVTFGLLLVTIVGGVVLTLPDVPFVALTIAALAVAVVVPIGFHPTAKLLWAALDLVMHPLEPGEAVVVAQERPPQQR